MEHLEYQSDWMTWEQIRKKANQKIQVQARLIPNVTQRLWVKPGKVQESMTQVNIHPSLDKVANRHYSWIQPKYIMVSNQRKTIMHCIILPKRNMFKLSYLKPRNLLYNNKLYISNLTRSTNTFKKSTALGLIISMHKLSLNLTKVSYLLS